MKEFIMKFIKSFETDKIEHYLVNVVIVLAVGSFKWLLGFGALALGLIVAVFFDLYKEYVCDAKPDDKDILADGWGALTGAVIFMLYMIP